MRVLILLVSLLAFSTIANSQVYKWTDQHGKTQYGDQPPIARDTSKVKINAASGTLLSGDGNGTASSTLDNTMDEFQERRDAKKEDAAIKQARAKENKKRCANAEARLRMLLETPYLSLPDGEGGTKNISDTERRKIITETKNEKAEFCT